MTPLLSREELERIQYKLKHPIAPPKPTLRQRLAYFIKQTSMSKAIQSNPAPTSIPIRKSWGDVICAILENPIIKVLSHIIAALIGGLIGRVL